MSNQAVLASAPGAHVPRFRTMRISLPTGLWIENLGQHLTRYSLVLILLWMGLLKFVAYEATAIQPMVAAHPLLSWLYELFGVATVSGLIGAVEIAAALLLALRPWSAIAGVAGGALAVGTFLITASFLLILPPVWEGSVFPFLSVMPGQFLIKDLGLLTTAIWVFGNALKDVRAV